MSADEWRGPSKNDYGRDDSKRIKHLLLQACFMLLNHWKPFDLLNHYVINNSKFKSGRIEDGKLSNRCRVQCLPFTTQENMFRRISYS